MMTTKASSEGRSTFPIRRQRLYGLQARLLLLLQVLVFPAPALNPPPTLADRRPPPPPPPPPPPTVRDDANLDLITPFSLRLLISETCSRAPPPPAPLLGPPGTCRELVDLGRLVSALLPSSRRPAVPLRPRSGSAFLLPLLPS